MSGEWGSTVEVLLRLDRIRLLESFENREASPGFQVELGPGEMALTLFALIALPAPSIELREPWIVFGNSPRSLARARPHCNWSRP